MCLGYLPIRIKPFQQQTEDSIGIHYPKPSTRESLCSAGIDCVFHHQLIAPHVGRHPVQSQSAVPGNRNQQYTGLWNVAFEIYRLQVDVSEATTRVCVRHLSVRVE